MWRQKGKQENGEDWECPVMGQGFPYSARAASFWGREGPVRY